MQKYVCNVCGYEYDPAAGDLTAASPPAPLLKICPKIGSVRLRRFQVGLFRCLR